MPDAAPPGDVGGAGRRGLDRVTAPDLLERAAGAPIDQVRALRDQCKDEEIRLSFARRMLQGRLDIVRAEVTRRAEGGATDLLASLPSILADAPTESSIGRSRSAPVYLPPEDGGRRHDDVLDDASLGRLPDLDDAELAAVAERLAQEERRVSSVRRTVLEHLDGLQAELVRRYQAAGDDLDDVVAAGVAPLAEPTTPDGAGRS